MKVYLKEYRWNSNERKFNTASGGTLIISPGPRSIKKSVKTTWRKRRAGLHKKIERGKWRVNEEIVWTVEGECDNDKRREIEFYSKRNSLYEVLNTPEMPDSFWTPYAVHTEDSKDRGGGTQEWTYWNNPTNTEDEKIYVLFEKINFTEREGKFSNKSATGTWISYTLTLKRVNPARSTG